MQGNADPELLARLEKLYTALSSADIATWESMHRDDCVYNVAGATPVSGRTEGKRKLIDELLPILFSRLQPEHASIGLRWKCMVSDGQRAAVIFEGETKTLEGNDYNNRYLQLIEFDDAGLVREVWEFFDTALAEAVLFTPDQQPPPGTGAFQY